MSFELSLASKRRNSGELMYPRRKYLGTPCLARAWMTLRLSLGRSHMGSKLRGTHFLRPVVAERNEKDIVPGFNAVA